MSTAMVSIPKDLLQILIDHSGKCGCWGDIAEYSKTSFNTHLLKEGVRLIRRFLEYNLLSQTTIEELFESACMSNRR